MQRLSSSLLFCALMIHNAHSQGVLASIQFGAGLHNDDFAGQVGDLGLGVDGSFVLPLGEDTPFWAGLEMGSLFYRTRARSVIMPESEIKLEPIKGVVLAHLIWRTQWSHPRFRPYIDISVGIQHFFSESSAQHGPLYGILEEGDTFSTTETERTFSGGAALGLMVLLMRPSERRGGSAWQELLFDMRARVLRGGEIVFYREIYREGSGDVDFERVDARTDMLLFQLGVAVRF